MATVGQRIRKEIIKRDKDECQLSKLFGIAHLSGVPCVEEKEAHHKTYERFNEEEPEDLIVVCRRCHDFLTSYIRGLRYSIRNGDLKPEDVARGELSMVTQERVRHEDFEFQNYRSRTTNPAQRVAGRPTIRRNKVDLEDFPQASQNRSRPGGDGKA